MGAYLHALHAHLPLPWNGLRDPELSRTPPAQRNTGHVAATAAFLSAVQDGRDEVMRAEFGAGHAVSVHLGECGLEARALLFKAAHEAMAGRANTAAELLRDFVLQVAGDYADNQEGAWL